MDLKKLQNEALSRGVEYIEKPNGHIQLKGPLLVNYYPLSKNRSAYVAGTTKKVTGVDYKAAVDMCFKAPVCNGKKDKRSGNSRQKRRALLKKGIKNCYWCKKPLTLDTSTLEHKIPLARGGLDNANNRTLACKKCNEARADDMPELNIRS